ncbi:ABC transporter ATP-binding protein [Enterococcus cecorum]|uniref:ABC transporter ATP-binding protein n=1 Tax=Enterococcus cecorum TaxID=44008 RepID=UPI0025A34BC3|nr:ABC transporter ATP-binding protein [Enterococcus cecorum]MDM8183773.1 ABC transporter ATP-binding protein [Enterococcus cecorum]
MLEVKSVKKSYGDDVVLKDVSLSVESGEIVGFVGENGAGKTTLIRAILGLHNIDSGEIIFNGVKNFQHNQMMMKQIGYLLDTELFEYLSAYQSLELMGIYEGERYSKQQIEDMLARVLLNVDNKPIKSYSYGMKQRLRLAMAMIRPRKLLILDEPLLGLDIKTIQEFKHYLREIANSGVAILLSSHQLSEIEDIIDRYMILDSGVIQKEVLGKQTAYKVSLGLDAADVQKFLSELEISDSDNIRVEGKNIYVISQDVLNVVLKAAYNQELNVKFQQINIVNQLFLDKGE